jgi:lincosamide nucleotidyltransferase A/C/D/E
MAAAAQLEALARLHRLFEEGSIDYWLFGGWAVDLHAGAVTREHGDLDIAIWHADLDRVAELLAGDGWVHAPEGAEDGSTGFARGEVRLEVAFLAVDESGEVYTPLSDGSRAGWAPEAFGDETGEVEGVRARVIGREALKAEKSESRDDPVSEAKDRADVATLDALG